jgi:hypothetical protein
MTERDFLSVTVDIDSANGAADGDVSSPIALPREWVSRQFVTHHEEARGYAIGHCRHNARPRRDGGKEPGPFDCTWLIAAAQLIKAVESIPGFSDHRKAAPLAPDDERPAETGHVRFK